MIISLSTKNLNIIKKGYGETIIYYDYQHAFCSKAELDVLAAEIRKSSEGRLILTTEAAEYGVLNFYENMAIEKRYYHHHHCLSYDEAVKKIQEFIDSKNSDHSDEHF